MDWNIILTGLGIVLAVIGCNVTLFSWLRGDIAVLRTDSAADRRDFLHLTREIQAEIKDFHGRLCAIEERNKK